jgi:hypothetical protein
MGHHSGVLGQVRLPGGVQGHHGGLQGQVRLLGVPKHGLGPIYVVHVPHRAPQLNPVPFVISMYLAGLPSIAVCDIHEPHKAAQLGPGALRDVHVNHRNPNLALEPSVMPHYIYVFFIIRPEKAYYGPVSLLLPHDVLDPLHDVPVPLHVPHILPGRLREVLGLLCAPHGVPEHF